VKGGRQVVDQRRRRGEEGVESVLNGSVRHGDGEMGLAAPGFAGQVSDRPSVMKSGDSAEPSIWRRNDD
jgi:hypothetical protein